MHPHLPLAVAADAMWIDGQHFSAIISARTPESAPGHLQLEGVLDGMFCQQIMYGAVTGDEGEAGRQLETTAIRQGSIRANPRGAESRLVDQLQSQSRFGPFRGLPGPAAQQIPRSQTEVFGHQQPHAHQMSADLVGQELPDTTFQTEGIAVGRLRARTRAPCHHEEIRHRVFARATLVEFFFAGRSPQ